MTLFTCLYVLFTSLSSRGEISALPSRNQAGITLTSIRVNTETYTVIHQALGVSLFGIETPYDDPRCDSLKVQKFYFISALSETT